MLSNKPLPLFEEDKDEEEEDEEEEDEEEEDEEEEEEDEEDVDSEVLLIRENPNIFKAELSCNNALLGGFKPNRAKAF